MSKYLEMEAEEGDDSDINDDEAEINPKNKGKFKKFNFPLES